MAEQYVKFSKDGAIGFIKFNRPPVNSYNLDFFKQLSEAIDQARFDAAVKVVIVTSEIEKFFSAGADVKMFAETGLDFKVPFIVFCHETLLKVEHAPKIFIAAINGHCLGGGLEIALACDLRFMARDAGKIGLPEVTLGVLPGNGGTQRLPRLVGKARAIDMMINGTTLTADEALQIGLIDRVFDKTELMSKTLEYARSLTQGATKAIGLIKRAVQEGSEMSLPEGLALERELLNQLFASKDADEGMKAFLEKRKAQFTGQ